MRRNLKLVGSILGKSLMEDERILLYKLFPNFRILLQCSTKKRQQNEIKQMRVITNQKEIK